MKIINEQEIRAAVGPTEALAAAERAFHALGEGTAVQPAPLGLDVPPVEGEVHVKGAYLAGSPIFALKIATGFYQNATRGLPSGTGVDGSRLRSVTNCSRATIRTSRSRTDSAIRSSASSVACWLYPHSAVGGCSSTMSVAETGPSSSGA